MTFLDDDFAYGCVGVAIAPGINEPGHSPFGRDQAGRTLHMHEKEIDPISQPRDFESTTGISAIFDIGTGWRGLWP